MKSSQSFAGIETEGVIHVATVDSFQVRRKQRCFPAACTVLSYDSNLFGGDAACALMQMCQLSGAQCRG